MKELLSFDWCGKMAHFRKFYSNASALSHTIPPRTTILGLLASIAGIERDKYYFGTENEVFNSLKIGVQLIHPVRKITQKFNYLKVVKEGASEESIASELKDIYIFRGYGNRKQVSTELIVPYNIREINAIVKYKIFVGFPDDQNPVFERMKENLQREYYPFGICLGTANMLGYIEWTNGKESISYERANYTTEYIEMATAIEESLVTSIDRNYNFSIEHDLFPASFTMSKELNSRVANETKTLLYSTDGQPLRVIMNNSDSIYFLPQLNQFINLL